MTESAKSPSYVGMCVLSVWIHLTMEQRFQRIAQSAANWQRAQTSAKLIDANVIVWHGTPDTVQLEVHYEEKK